LVLGTLPVSEDSVKKTEGHPTSSSPNQIVRQLEHPERRLTLLFIATAGIFALVGTTLGTFMLSALSGVPTNLGLELFSAHPYLQIYGFIAEFVAGVAYSLLPRFKVGRIPSLGLGYATYVLLTCANVLFFVSAALSSYAVIISSVAALLIMAGSVTFAAQVFSLALRPTGGFAETNSLIMLSSLSLVLISLTLLLEELGLVAADEFSPQMIFLALLGFAGSMIYSVEIRSVSFRQSDYRKRLARLTSAFQASAIGVIFLSVFLPLSFLSIAGATLFLCGSLSLILSIKIFEFSRPLMYRPAMTKIHFSILRYNEVGILSGSVWLLFGIILGIDLIASNSTIFFVRDSFIHSIAIGFIGSTIIVFAPMLLPGLLGKRAPISGLSYGPIVLLNAGILLRVVGDSLTFVRSSSILPIWESVSGPLILGAMVWFLIVLHNVGRHPESLVVGASASSIKSSSFGVGNVRDAAITVISTRTGRETTLSVWFVEDDRVIYLLPMHRTETKWYLSALSNPRIRLEINKRIFSGEVKDISEKKRVERVKDLFKDKYGERVYRNFYGNQPDRALMITISEG
jgi:hypothetical protein